MAQKTNSLAHTKWMCKYHIVFTPKYRPVSYTHLDVYKRQLLSKATKIDGNDVITPDGIAIE